MLRRRILHYYFVVENNEKQALAIDKAAEMFCNRKTVCCCFDKPGFENVKAVKTSPVVSIPKLPFEFDIFVYNLFYVQLNLFTVEFFFDKKIEIDFVVRKFLIRYLFDIEHIDRKIQEFIDSFVFDWAVNKLRAKVLVELQC